MKRLTHFFVKPLSLAFDEGSSELGPEQSFLLQSYVRKHYTGKRQSILVAGRATQDEKDGLEAERAYAVAKLIVEMGIPEKDVLIKSGKAPKIDDNRKDEFRSVLVHVEALSGRIMRHADKILLAFLGVFILVNVLGNMYIKRNSGPDTDRMEEAVAAALKGSGIAADTIKVLRNEPIRNYALRTSVEGFELQMYNEMLAEVGFIHMSDAKEREEACSKILHDADSILSMPPSDIGDSIAFRIASAEKGWIEGMMQSDSLDFEKALSGARKELAARLSGGEQTDGYRITAYVRTKDGQRLRLFFITPADHLELKPDGGFDIGFLSAPLAPPEQGK